VSNFGCEGRQLPVLVLTEYSLTQRTTKKDFHSHFYWEIALRRRYVTLRPSGYFQSFWQSWSWSWRHALSLTTRHIPVLKWGTRLGVIPMDINGVNRRKILDYGEAGQTLSVDTILIARLMGFAPPLSTYRIILGTVYFIHWTLSLWQGIINYNSTLNEFTHRWCANTMIICLQLGGALPTTKGEAEACIARGVCRCYSPPCDRGNSLGAECRL